MKATKKQINAWKLRRKQGDNKALCNILDKQPATISRIMLGKQDTTSDLILKIDLYFSIRQVNYINHPLDID